MPPSDAAERPLDGRRSGERACSTLGDEALDEPQDGEGRQPREGDGSLEAKGEAGLARLKETLAEQLRASGITPPAF